MEIIHVKNWEGRNDPQKVEKRDAQLKVAFFKVLWENQDLTNGGVARMINKSHPHIGKHVTTARAKALFWRDEWDHIKPVIGEQLSTRKW